MKFGQQVTRLFNFSYPRRVDGAWIQIPVVGGFKVGIRGELFLLDIFKHFLPRLEGAVIDIGANVGQTLAKIKLAESTRRYYGFEPNVSCFAYLERIVADNRWNDVTLFPFGLADATAVLSLNVAEDRATDGRGSFVEGMPTHETVTQAKHAAVFDFASIGHLIDERIALIKIDVEGAELDVLIGLRDALERQRPLLCIEFLPLEQLSSRHLESISLLQSWGYHLFLVEKHANKRWAGLRAIERYELFDDIHCSDFVAVHRNSLALLEGIALH